MQSSIHAQKLKLEDSYDKICIETYLCKTKYKVIRMSKCQVTFSTINFKHRLGNTRYFYIPSHKLINSVVFAIKWP